MSVFHHTRYLLIILMLAFFSIRLHAQGGCSCTNCPQNMPDNFQGNFLIQVQNAANPTLGQNGQGVCGVILNFDHEYIGDLLITLTSPAGQTVTLIGPVGLFGETDGTTWNITFVPCGDTPDPDPGFSATWSNNQNWGLLGNYTGSYYPMTGCLENFNTGPVNGQWTLSVTDGQVNDMGNFYDYQIIFCDPTDILCFSCEANAGNLLQPDVTACEGSPSLSLNLIPSYTVQQPAPPASEYSYTYIIASGGAIIGYDPAADLSAYPAGNYTICGISYLTVDETDLPPPDGSMTITQLAAQLNSSSPPFCGKITANCVNVTIKPLPADVEDYETICSPECVEYYGNVFCTSGDHVVQLTDDGCPYTATLHLDVLQRVYKTINETICPGACSGTPGFEQACTAGQYTSVLTGENGCDSVVTLNLNVLNVQATIQQPPPLSCTQASLLLQGSGSTPPAPGVTYAWTASNGGKLSGPANGINASATSAGAYILQVCRSSGTVSCCDTAMVQVQANQDPPPAPGAISGPAFLCTGQLSTFRVDSVPNISVYQWSVPQGMTLIAGQGSATILVSGQINSPASICVQAKNDCGTSSASCREVFPATFPVAQAPAGNGLVCPGDTLVFTTASVDSVVGFAWSFPPGVTIISGENNDTVQVHWLSGQEGQVCVAAINSCDTGALACTGIKIVDAPATPAVLGPTQLCAGTVASYQTNAGPGITAYNWAVTGGTILGKTDSSKVDVLWNMNSDTGTLCLTLNNACRSSTAGCQSVVIYPLVQANAGADSAVCGLQYPLAASIPPQGSTGAWTLVAGPGVATFADSAAAQTTVTVSIPGPYMLEWAVTAHGCIEKDSVRIDFLSAPSTEPITVTCDPSNENYVVSFSILGGAPPYLVNSATIQGEHYASTSIPNGGSYSFFISDQNNCFAASLAGTHDCNCLSSAGNMSADTLQACAGQTVQAALPSGKQLDGNDSLFFVLHTSPGTTLDQVIALSTSGVFGIQTGMVTGEVYYISAVVGNMLPGGTPDWNDPCLSVAKGQPLVFHPLPDADAGLDVAACGDTLTLLAQNPAGTWTLADMPAGGLAQLETAHAPSSVVVANQPGTYLFNWTVTAQGCSDTDQVQATFYTIPEISDIDFICDSTNENYQVSFVINGGAVPYSVNNTIESGNLYTSGTIPNNDSYNFIISDSQGCQPFPISGAHSCQCQTYAGEMNALLLTVCATDSIQSIPASNPHLDGNDIAIYVLHTDPGAALGQIWAQNQSGKFGFVPGMAYGQTYYISRVVGTELNGAPNPADPCLAIAPGQPVRFLEVPNPLLGPDLATCGLSLELKADSSTFSGKWEQVSGPSTANLSAFASFVTQANVSKAGAYVFRYTAENGICSGSDEVLATFNEVPVLTSLSVLCDNANTGFVVLFSIANGLPPFVIDGLSGLLNGSSFVSIPLLNNSNFSFSVSDANGCHSAPVSGTKNCQCATDAGTLSPTAVLFCAGQAASATPNNNGNLDADDMLVFVLHDQAGPQLGNILAQNNKPEFAFSAGLSTGVTYYISAVAGTAVGGQLNLSDPCLSVSPGIPVRWKDLPTATISAPSRICAGQTAELLFSGTGDFPLTVNYSSSSGQSDLTISGLSGAILPVMPESTTTYFLNSVADGSQPGCVALLDSSFTIEVEKPVQAGEPVGIQELCGGSTSVIALATLLSGADGGGQWSEVSAIPSAKGFDAANGIFAPAQEQAGVYLFQYTVQGAAACPADSSLVEVQVWPVPLADAGPDAELDCLHPEVVLSGPGTSIGPGISYQWVLNGIPQTGAVEPSRPASVPGSYVLSVKNEYGCEATDTANVFQTGGMVFPPLLRIVPPACFGEKNGGIFIDSIFGGTAPYEFWLNGVSMGSKNDFSPLLPGTYTLTVQDAEGCEWNSGPLLLPEPFETKINLGATIEAALGDSVYLLLETNLPAVATDTILWRPLLDSSAAGQPFQTFMALHSGKIQVTVQDTNGCRVQDELLIVVNRQRNLYFPNAIAPNRPENNMFLIYGGKDVAEIERLEIFDRWGERVFAASHFQAGDSAYGWDGRLNGKELDPGVFIFQAAVRFRDGEQEQFNGSITLLR